MKLENFSDNLFLHFSIYLLVCLVATLLVTMIHFVMSIFLFNIYANESVLASIGITLGWAVIHYVSALFLCFPFYLLSISCILLLKLINNPVVCAFGGIITSIPSLLFISSHGITVRIIVLIVVGSIAGILYYRLCKSI